MEGKRKEKGRIVEQKKIGKDIYSMWIETRLSESGQAGQFLAVYPKGESMLLPRPISICERDKKRGRLRIVYRIAGKGTREFSQYEEGETIDVMGPIGNGFPLLDKKAIVIGGGIGIPPLLELVKEYKGKKEIILGFKEEIFMDKEFLPYGSVEIATENGSAGRKGNVLDILEKGEHRGEIILACGPLPMLKGVAEYAKKREIPAYISLEEKMACGIGACLACVCKMKEKDSHTQVPNRRICVDGPVFLAQEVDFS